MKEVADLCCDEVGYVCILCLCELFDGILDHRDKVSFPLGIMRPARLLDASRALLEPGSCGVYPGIDIIGCGGGFPSDAVEDVLLVAMHDLGSFPIALWGSDGEMRPDYR